MLDALLVGFRGPLLLCCSCIHALWIFVLLLIHITLVNNRLVNTILMNSVNHIPRSDAWLRNVCDAGEWNLVRRVGQQHGALVPRRRVEGGCRRRHVQSVPQGGEVEHDGGLVVVAQLLGYHACRDTLGVAPLAKNVGKRAPTTFPCVYVCAIRCADVCSRVRR